MLRCEVGFLVAGSCRHPECMAIAGGGLNSVTFPAIVGLIRHPSEGWILFDTGYDPAFLAATEPFPERLYRLATPMTLGPGESVAEQLAARGLTTADIAWVVISHFHGDHVAGLHAFPSARIACAKAGLESIRCGSRFSRIRRGLLAALVPADADARIVPFETMARTALSADFAPLMEAADILGDGSLLAIELPGHCPGHWGLAVRGDDDRLHLLAGDAAWSSRAIRENRPPPSLTTSLLGDTPVYRRTLLDLQTLSRRNGDLLITPAHCTERAAQVRG
jgi:glyoxylase-like metal-dependent hydrolase (beta-lactamase superfamily II)